MNKRKPLIIGLTGGIGMGKSTAAQILQGFGLSVYSADKAVHHLLRKDGKGVKRVAKLFPEALKRGAIDRKVVGQSVFHNPTKLKQLEKILHPMIHKSERRFIAEAKKKKATAVVLEIPLLFETRAEKRCDIVLCATAPRAIQEQRVMARRHMSKARFSAILKLQMPDRQKRIKADYVVHTGKSYGDTKRQLARILSDNKLT
jgi:dephospho-CoA kinase